MSEPLDDLRAELRTIEPSEAFERRTLARIAETRASRGRVAHWIWMVPAAAAVIVAAVSFQSARHAAALSRATTSAVAYVENVPMVTVANTAQPERPKARSRAAAAAWRIPPTAHRDQAIAVRRLMVYARAGQVFGAADTMVADEGAVPLPAPIEIKPIVIAPLVSGQGGGSEK